MEAPSGEEARSAPPSDNATIQLPGVQPSEAESWKESCGSIEYRIWFLQDRLVHTPPISPVGSQRRSGVFCNPASSDESGAGVTSKFVETHESKEADRHYQYEDAIVAFRAKQVEDALDELEGDIVRRILDRGTGASEHKLKRAKDYQKHKQLEKKARIAEIKVAKVKHLLQETEKEYLLAKNQLQEWQQSSRRWPATTDSSDEEEEDYFDWRGNLGFSLGASR
jgi:hypothetical protein